MFSGDRRIIYWAYCIFLYPFIIHFGCNNEVPPKTSSQSVTLEQKSFKQDIVGARLLIVHSFHAELTWCISINDGIMDRIKDTGVIWDTFYLDAMRHPDTTWIKHAGELAMAKVAEFKPDIMITADDEAQQYFGQNYINSDLPIVFCGVNADASKYGYPASNITGIIDRPHFNKALELARRFFLIERIAILSSDDINSMGAITFIKERLDENEKVTFKFVNNYNDWKKEIMSYNDSVDLIAIYKYHTIIDNTTGKVLSHYDVLNWTLENTKLPTIGFYELSIKDGLLMGVVESGHTHGYKAADYAIALLEGASISSLPIIQPMGEQNLINSDTAKKMGFKFDKTMLQDVKLVP